MNRLVPENIRTLTTEGNGNFDGREGPKGGKFRWGGIAFRGPFPGAQIKICLFVCFCCCCCFFKLTAALLAKLSDILLLTGVSKQEFLFSLLIR